MFLVASSPILIATAVFQSCRGHDIHRDNYINAILEHSTNFQPTSSSRSTHSPLPAIQQRFSEQQPMSSNLLQLNWQLCPQTQSNQATVIVQPSDLIPDGCGAFYVRVRSNGPIPSTVVPTSTSRFQHPPPPLLLHHPPPSTRPVVPLDANELPVPRASWNKGRSSKKTNHNKKEQSTSLATITKLSRKDGSGQNGPTKAGTYGEYKRSR